MDKLYWIVCEEGDKTLFEGRYLGRTRGAAIKHLKDQLGRASLTGLVFSITEIPVPLIREIVAEILGQSTGEGVPEIRPAIPTPPAQRYDAFQSEGDEEEAAPEPTPFQTRGSPRRRDWDAAKALYMSGRRPKDIAKELKIPMNTLSCKISRDGWAHERREVGA